MELTSLSLWRLAPRLSVEDAAILLAGGDPSEMEEAWFEDEHMEFKKTTGHAGFVAAFSALKAAIQSRQLKAQLAYPVQNTSSFSPNTFSLPDSWILSNSDFSQALSNGGSSEIETPFDDEHEGRRAVLVREPDWTRSMVEVGDLRSWLRSKGITEGFFFPKTEADPDDFLDQAHDHFAPELALAVTVWRALANEQRFPRGPKAAIESWIARNPDAWKGDEALGERAKDRIATLINWDPRGGAPKSGT